jgi:hypothetical protein
MAARNWFEHHGCPRSEGIQRVLRQTCDNRTRILTVGVVEPKTWLETVSGNTTATFETKAIFKRNLSAGGEPELIPVNDQVEGEWVF